MERPNILSEEEKLKLKMLAQKSSSNIKDAIRDEVARVEVKTNTEEWTKVKINPRVIDEELEL